MSDQAFPIISVRDLAAVSDFYRELGFVETYRFPPDGDPEFVTLERGPSTIGLGAAAEPDEDRFAYWVYVDDVDEKVAALQLAGATVVGEPKDEPWGERVAHVRDPAGNLVHIGAPS
jgi:predicted enzyme related to lactoylglutathione lyase